MDDIETKARKEYDNVMKLGEIVRFAVNQWTETYIGKRFKTSDFFHIAGVFKGFQEKYTAVGEETFKIDQAHGSTTQRETYDALADITAEMITAALCVEVGLIEKK